MGNGETNKSNIIAESIVVVVVLGCMIWFGKSLIDKLFDKYVEDEVVIVFEEVKEVEPSDIVTVDFVETKVKCTTSDGVMVVVRFTVLKGYSISVSKSHYYGIIRVLPAETIHRKLMQITFLGTQIHQVHFEGEFDKLARVNKNQAAQVQLQKQKLLEVEAQVAKAKAMSDVEMQIAIAKAKQQIILKSITDVKKY